MITNQPPDQAPAVQITGVTKRFGSLTAVDRVDLDIPAGQVLALLGRNGAGKSTLMEMMLGIVRPDAGAVRIGGRSPQDASRHGAIGAMLQNGVLMDEETVRSMLRLLRSLHARPLPLDEVAERADITDLMSRRIGKLSGGQKQRVRFAIALLGDPDVILLDEPTVGMDVETRLSFWQRIRHVSASGRTIVLATHYLQEAESEAERVVVLDAGSIIADGPGAEITRSVAGRRLRVVGPDAAEVALLPGVTEAVVDGDGVLARCTDSDATLRALLLAHPGAHGIEVSPPSLEDAFLRLTEGAHA
ncbi:ABC transporter ATP-binding protein [Brachybacterium hainanense]|uniref:ATP-binding cassette domain-containing protein n=1 Tax=Brachybacterium hainanense TaxID=1541174 RepID=A0ABV6REC8_9MICO